MQHQSSNLPRTLANPPSVATNHGLVPSITIVCRPVSTENITVAQNNQSLSNSLHEYFTSSQSHSTHISFLPSFPSMIERILILHTVDARFSTIAYPVEFNMSIRRFIPQTIHNSTSLVLVKKSHQGKDNAKVDALEHTAKAKTDMRQPPSVQDDGQCRG